VCRFMGRQYRAALCPPGCVPPQCAQCAQCVASIFRSSGGGAARERPHSGIYVRRRPAPRQYHTAAPRGYRTSGPPTRSSPVRPGRRMQPCPVSHHGVEQGVPPSSRRRVPWPLRCCSKSRTMPTPRSPSPDQGASPVGVPSTTLLAGRVDLGHGLSHHRQSLPRSPA